MIELSFTLVFHPRDWGFGFGYPEVVNGPGIPCIGLHTQFICFQLNITLYKMWELKDESEE